jgi:hypothetical protein
MYRTDGIFYNILSIYITRIILLQASRNKTHYTSIIIRGHQIEFFKVHTIGLVSAVYTTSYDQTHIRWTVLLTLSQSVQSLGYELADRGIGVPFTADVRYNCLLQSV